MARHCLLFLIAILILWQESTAYYYNTFYVKQKVDHFGFGNNDYFFQRYLIDWKTYDYKNGTIFFYTGNEGDIEMFANNTGFMWENALTYKALVVFAEHRYYGKSMPYGEDSFKDNEHRGYLTSEQALADFAYLISDLKQTFPGAHRAPVIAFGGSYGGMLAAWFRIKYPHLVDGAIASSAPILQFDAKAPCGRFAEIVTEDFKNAGVSCSKSITRSWEIINKYGKSESGLKFLTDTFKLCDPLQGNNVDALKEWLINTWVYLAMTDYPYPTNFLNPLPGYPINVVCSYLGDESAPEQTLMVNIAKAASVFHNYTGNIKCNNLNDSGGSSLGEKGWDYQSCTEMVGPECYNGVTDMFEPMPWDFGAYTTNCLRNWGVEPIGNMAPTIYGGRNITASSNIIFTNGKLDPWHGGGILTSLSDTLVAIFIENAAHHLDLRSSNAADPDSVVNARNLMKKWIWKWISEKQ